MGSELQQRVLLVTRVTSSTGDGRRGDRGATRRRAHRNEPRRAAGGRRHLVPAVQVVRLHDRAGVPRACSVPLTVTINLSITSGCVPGRTPNASRMVWADGDVPHERRRHGRRGRRSQRRVVLPLHSGEHPHASVQLTRVLRRLVRQPLCRHRLAAGLDADLHRGGQGSRHRSPQTIREHRGRQRDDRARGDPQRFGRRSRPPHRQRADQHDGRRRIRRMRRHHL